MMMALGGLAPMMAPVLGGAVLTSGQDLGGLLLDPLEGRMLRAIPLIRLARTPGTGLDEPLVDEAVRRFAAS